MFTHLRHLKRFALADDVRHVALFHGGDETTRAFREIGLEADVAESLAGKNVVKIYRDVKRFIERREIDVIHSHLIKPYVFAGLANIRARRGHAYNYHGLFIENPYNSALEKAFYRFAHRLVTARGAVDAAVAPSRRSADLVRAETDRFPEILHYYNAAEPIDVEPNPKIVRRIEQAKAAGNKLVAVVAKAEVAKRLDVALRIADRLREEPIRFFFFGDGPQLEDVFAVRKMLRLERTTVFFGFVPGAPAYLPYFDAALFSSDREGTPIALIEAMAAGVPVVATDAGGVAEATRDPECALLYEPRDDETGAALTRRLLEDDALRTRLGENGREAARRRHNPERFAEFFLALYRRLAKRDGDK